jgi:nucleoside-diphosphate-sugar epimerase
MTLRGEQVLVTGASGFVGGALVARLLADGVRVRGLVRSAEKGARLAALGMEPVVGDLIDPAVLPRAVAGCALVFHVGAATGGALALQYEVNVTAVGRLADAAATAGVGRLVHVSSLAAYGYGPPAVVTEDSPLCPGVEYYGQSKALGEAMLRRRAAARGLPFAILRPGLIYGPRSGFWTGGAFRLMDRTPAFLPGAADQPCPAVFVDDVVDLLITAAEHPGAVGEAFNAVSDPQPTLRDFLGAYAAMAGREVLLPIPLAVLRGVAGLAEVGLRLYSEPQPVRAMVDSLIANRRVYPMDKAARLLDWRAKVGLVEGMARAEAWLRETGRLR